MLVAGASVTTLPRADATTLGAAAQLLLDSEHGAYPVTDADERFEGTISRGQLIALLGAHAHAKGGSPTLTHEQLLDAEAEATDEATVKVLKLRQPLTLTLTLALALTRALLLAIVVRLGTC